MKNDYKNVQKKYFKLLFPNFGESNNEYITIRYANNESSFEKHYQKIDDCINEINKYKYYYNIYTCVALTDGKGRKFENGLNRSCIVVDFDEPDYTIDDLIGIAKELKLYYHMLINSGNGYHMYFFTETSKDLKYMQELNKRISFKANADMNACKSTQLIRVPYTYNRKDEDTKLVRQIWLANMVRRYTITVLERMFKPSKSKKILVKVSNMYCINQMLKGVQKGHRNFALGRLTKYFQLQQYSLEQIKEILLEWNIRCEPMQSEKELITNIEYYYKNDYKLLGCKTKNPHIQTILSHYCDKYNCVREYKLDNCKFVLDECINYNNRILKNQLNAMKGKELILFGILIYNKDGLSKKQMQAELTSHITNKKYISNRQTLNKVLDKLKEKKLISSTKVSRAELFHITKENCKDYGMGYTDIKYQALKRVIDIGLTPNAYKLYIGIRYYISSKGRSPSYFDLEQQIGIRTKDISLYLKELEQNSFIDIRYAYNPSGTVKYNQYTIK